MSAKRSLRSPVALPRGRQGRRSGFTLVEVLVVVGILVVLAGIVVPMVSKARAQASRAKCSNTLRGLGQAVIAFAGEHNSTLPTCGVDVAISPPPASAVASSWIGWSNSSSNPNVNASDIDTANKTDYMNESGLAKYLGVGAPDQSNAPNEKLRRLYRCDSVTEDQRSTGTTGPYPFDYQFNIQLSGMPLDRVEKAGQKGMIAETDHRDDSAYIWWSGAPTPTGSGGQDQLTGQDAQHPLRHGGRGDNCLYADGHVDIIGYKSHDDFKVWDAYYTPATSSTLDTESQPKNGTYGAAK